MFVPKRIIFEKDALQYDMGKEILDRFKDKDTEILYPSARQWKGLIPGEDLSNLYRESKQTLIVGIKKGAKFQTCKPSAHYQLPLVSGCMGQCEYCYLNTMLGDRPYVKVYANIDDILEQARGYITNRLPEITIFEGAATSDPVPLEPYSHALERAILFFAENRNGRFRFVTKYGDIESLLTLKHHGNTEVRFSLNTPRIIREYEHATANSKKRIEASIRMMEAGYPIGYLIAPVILYEGWKEDYHELMLQLRKGLPGVTNYPITFEIISHRYTIPAKNRILQVFPENTLPMKEEERKFKYGQFGYGKYIYPDKEMEEVKNFFAKEVEQLFKNGVVKYII